MENTFVEGKVSEDFPQRRADFIKGYGELVEKHQCDFMTTPSYMPNEKGSWELFIHNEIIDKRFLVKSPVVVG